MSDIAHMFAPFNAEQNVQKWNPGIDNDHMANIRGIVSPALANTESSSALVRDQNTSFELSTIAEHNYHGYLNM
jgi:hypothetical protein